MKYRRGFKAEANWYAREMRKELGVPLHGPLCPWQLTQHLGFKVYKLSDFQLVAPAPMAYFQSAAGQREFSAVTVYIEGQAVIIHNDSHHPWRQAANLAHEAAHGLLCHPMTRLTDESGARVLNRQHEDEANWLGPALLISEEAALYIAEHRLTAAIARELYKVSNEVLQMRLRVTGAVLRIARRPAA